MVSPQTRENCRRFKEEKGLTMELLTDPGNCLAETFGLVYRFPEDLKQAYLQLGINLAEYNGDVSWRLPMPARYIIDSDGVVRYARASADHTERPDPAETIEALRKIRR